MPIKKFRKFPFDFKMVFRRRVRGLPKTHGVIVFDRFWGLRMIKFLTREFREIKSKLTQSKNQLHAMKHGYNSPDSCIRRVNRQIALLNTQLLEIEAEIRLWLCQTVSFMSGFKRYARYRALFMTSVTIIAGTNTNWIYIWHSCFRTKYEVNSKFPFQKARRALMCLAAGATCG